VRLAAFDGVFGRVEGDHVIPMGDDIVSFLADGASRDGTPVALADATFGPPVRRPGKIIGVGLNYRDHAEETGQPVPSEPVLFAKFATSVIGPGDAIVVPEVVTQPDYEAELGVVIGRTASHVGEARALDHVGGYLCVNDVSARDLQFHSTQWMLGKAIDSFLPCGPWLVTPDEVPDPQALGIRCALGREMVQDSTTSNMVFGVAELIAFISRTLTLEPGDLIATGTPSGVGMSRTPQRWLEDGEEVSVEIDGIGRLTNTVRKAAPTGGVA